MLEPVYAMTSKGNKDEPRRLVLFQAAISLPILLIFIYCAHLATTDPLRQDPTSFNYAIIAFLFYGGLSIAPVNGSVVYFSGKLQRTMDEAVKFQELSSNKNAKKYLRFKDRLENMTKAHRGELFNIPIALVIPCLALSLVRSIFKVYLLTKIFSPRTDTI